MLEDPVSLAELAQELRVNKSKLSYYTTKGLLKPSRTVSNTMIFDRPAAIKRITFIEEQKKKGKTLEEIAHLR